MGKVSVQLAKLGDLNTWVDLTKVIKWRSSLFEVLPEVDRHRLPTRAAGLLWNFLDNQISYVLPRKLKGDFVIALTDSPLEGNYYMRRLSGNRACISLFQVRDILSRENIPIENYVLKCIYEALIFYTVATNSGGELPKSEVNYTHDETKGCLFDMAGNKADLAVSCKGPILCDTCYADLSRSGVPVNLLDSVRQELKRITTPTYYRIVSVIKKHPILSILITGLTAIILNIISDLIIRLFK